MGRITGFKEFKREVPRKAPVQERLAHYKEFETSLEDEKIKLQGARCMDCGVAFCHGDTGCPVENLIPEFNDLVYRGRWKEALNRLHSTNNFPEFTGRLCPAPCEGACTLGLISPPVSIKAIERFIIDNGFTEGWVEPLPPSRKTGKSIAVVGSGPAGMACSQQLARAGHSVTLFEKNERIGGLMRFGIPDFKMEKENIDRRRKQMEVEGVEIQTGVHVGIDISGEELMKRYDAVVLALGSEQPRDLPVPGRELKGVHFAMDYLTRQNRINAGDPVENRIDAKDKVVVVIGGGDTGSDCVGTANRQGAKKVYQLEIFPMPPEQRSESNPWPNYPMIMRTSSSHEEGCERLWSVTTKGFKGNAKGELKSIHGNQVKFEAGKFVDLPGTEFEWQVDLVFLALGFVQPVHAGLLEELEHKGLEYDPRGNVRANFGKTRGGTPVHPDGDHYFETTIPGVYACGDVRRGQSLIVWAIAEGRQCAAAVHKQLMTSH